MKRTCLQKNTKTDEQNTCEFYPAEILLEEQLLDPKDNQQFKSFAQIKTQIFILSALVLVLLFTSCDKKETEELIAEAAKSAMVATDHPAHVFTTSIDDLTQADIDGLLLMREEEKLARDVYQYFYEQYKFPVFERIAASESRHMEAMLSLLNHFGIEDPVLEKDGQFSNPEIQDLYNKLVEKGSTIEEALAVGAYIEEYDIADLAKLIEETQNADIKTVYSNLLKGSENHLRAFVRSLTVRKVEYVPQILSEENYAAILAGKNQSGKGQGNNRQGYGPHGRWGNQNLENGGVALGDADGDGICDTTGEPVVEAKKQVRKGFGRKAKNN